MRAFFRIVLMAAATGALATNTYAQSPSDRTEAQTPAPKVPLMNDAAFAFTIEEADQQAQNIARHSLSAMTCPYIIENHALTKVTQFSLSGHDVACGYNSNDSSSYITIYMSRYGEEATPDVTLNLATEQIDNAYTVISRSDINSPTLNFAGTPLQCRQQQFRIVTGGTERNSGLWTCNIDGWAFKIRATWDGLATQTDQGIDDFLGRQSLSAETLNQCKAMRSEFETDAVVSEPDLTTPLLYATNMPSPPDMTKPFCYLNMFSTAERALLLGWQNQIGAPIFVAEQYDGFGAIQGTQLQLAKAPPSIALIKQELSGKATEVWHLSAFNGADNFQLFKAYDSVPSFAQITDGFLKVASGMIEPIGGISVDEDGNTTISVPSSTDDEEEETDEGTILID